MIKRPIVSALMQSFGWISVFLHISVEDGIINMSFNYKYMLAKINTWAGNPNLESKTVLIR